VKSKTEGGFSIFN